MNKLANRLISFLNNELDIATTDIHFMLNDIHKMQLNHLTTLINVEGSVKVLILISYQQSLFDEIFLRYTRDLSIAEDELEEAMVDSAGDIINIIVGNTLTDINNEPKKIIMSPPLIITAAKQLAGQRHAMFYKANLITALGQLDIYLVSSTIGETDE
ncbi:hypothetical protein DOJK_01237 [Patescibacteria group bacterium]|nr:hypothetical protein DOJK_01237 [Patescibacteria group bacterium]